MTLRKNHSNTFKLQVALEATKENQTIAELCHKFGIAASQIYLWKKQLEEHGSEIFADKRKVDHQGEVDRLHRVIGKITA